MSPRVKFGVVLAAGVLFGLAFFSISSKKSPDEVFRIGWDALDRGDWKTLAGQIDGLRNSPSHIDQLRLLRGGLYLKTGDSDAAVRELNLIPSESDLHE